MLLWILSREQWGVFRRDLLKLGFCYIHSFTKYISQVFKFCGSFTHTVFDAQSMDVAHGMYL